MATPTTPYRRIRGLGSGAFEYVRLFLAPDHLLAVTSSGYTETYKRFYFRDIQSIAVRKTNRGKVWNIVWGVLFWIFGIAVAIDASGDAMFFWLGVAAVFLVLLVVNIGRGPTCVTEIKTAVQTRRLTPLNRLRRTSKLIAQLKPLIEATQGPLPPDELAQRLDQARRGVNPIAQVATMQATEPAAASNIAPAPSESSLPPAG